MLDLVIIGGAAVGCSAAIYAARRKLNCIVVTENIGGEVALSGETNNWPGIQSIQGFELAQQFAAHAKSYGVPFDEGWVVTEIIPTSNYHFVKATNSLGEEKVYQTKTIIIGTGIHPRRLGIPGETELDRKGITSCTVCDGPLFKGKDTVTVGSGNSALESALMMAEIARQVYVLSKYPNSTETQGGFPKGDKILIDKLKTLPTVKIFYQTMISAIHGQERVEAIRYQDSSGLEHGLAVQGVMIHIGMIPNSQFAKLLAKNKQGEIITDKLGRTNIPGIFAAGDVTDIPHKQIGIAAGEGIVAALEAIGYINLWKSL